MSYFYRTETANVNHLEAMAKISDESEYYLCFSASFI